MYIVGKYSDIEVSQLAFPTSARGEYRMILRNSMGQVQQDTGWRPNIITDYGLVRMMQVIGVTQPRSSWDTYCHIGSDATAPAVTDTALGTQLGQTSLGISGGTVQIAPTAPLYEYSGIRGWRFEAGVGTGTVREIGWSHTSINTGMSVRALVSPAVVKGADNVLDVYHKLTQYPYLSDVTGSIVIDGVTYNYTIRGQGYINGTHARSNGRICGIYAGNQTAYNGAIGATVEDSPSYTAQDNSDTQSFTAEGSGYHDFECEWDLDDGNLSGGIRTVRFLWQSSAISNVPGGCAVDFGAGIPKDNTKKFTCKMRATLARH